MHLFVIHEGWRGFRQRLSNYGHSLPQIVAMVAEILRRMMGRPKMMLTWAPSRSLCANVKEVGIANTISNLMGTIRLEFHCASLDKVLEQLDRHADQHIQRTHTSATHAAVFSSSAPNMPAVRRKP